MIFRDFEGLLNSQYIKPAKTRGFFDEFQEKVDSLVFAGGYLRNPSDPKNIWEFDWKRVRREKQEKPRFLRIFFFHFIYLNNFFKNL